MKSTVLGAIGFIGRHLLQALAVRGEDVYAPNRGYMAIFTRPPGQGALILARGTALGDPQRRRISQIVQRAAQRLYEKIEGRVPSN